MKIIHCLNWELKEIKKNLPLIKEQGFDTIQINPLQPLKETGGPGEWWLSYQPVSFEIGNYFGTKEDLKELTETAGNYDIRIISDVVCNHLAQNNDGTLNPHPLVPEKYRNNPNFWKEKRNVYDWNNRYEVINYCMGLPGLNVNNNEVKKEIFKFLDELVESGVKGFRFDAAKSIGLPEEGVSFWKEIQQRYSKDDFIIYGEVIFGSTELIDAYTKYMMVLTNEYFGNNHNKIINFAESHDTFLSHDQLGYTKHRSNEEIAWDYASRSENFENMLLYARPWEKTLPWEENWKLKIIKDANKKNVKQYIR